MIIKSVVIYRFAGVSVFVETHTLIVPVSEFVARETVIRQSVFVGA